MVWRNQPQPQRQPQPSPIKPPTLGEHPVLAEREKGLACKVCSFYVRKWLLFVKVYSILGHTIYILSSIPSPARSVAVFPAFHSHPRYLSSWLSKIAQEKSYQRAVFSFPWCSPIGIYWLYLATMTSRSWLQLSASTQQTVTIPKIHRPTANWTVPPLLVHPTYWTCTIITVSISSFLMSVFIAAADGNSTSV